MIGEKTPIDQKKSEQEINNPMKYKMKEGETFETDNILSDAEPVL